MALVNYWFEVQKEPLGQYTLTIKANSDIINIVEDFDEADHAEAYAEAYIRGFKDARGEYES